MAGGGQHGRRLILLLSAGRAAWPRFVEELPLPSARASVGAPAQTWNEGSPSFCGLVTLVMLDQVRSGSTIRAMAQMKPTSSRAMAVTTLGAALPVAIRWR